MSNTITIVLVGVGGYAAHYVQELAQNAEKNDVKVVGVVDPYAATSRYYQTILDWNVPILNSVEEFFASNKADLAIISTPIMFHAHQAIVAMQHGAHVLVEKPIAATLEDAEAMIATRDQTGRLMAVGYQWCYDPAMRALKADRDAGLFGAPIDLRALVVWARDFAYYKRGLGWAGKKHDANGNAIFDNVVSNATAHYLENMLWLAGHGYQGATVAHLDSQTARANQIEMFDTAVLRAQLEGGGQLTFVASHAAGPGNNQEPMLEYQFEKATIRFGSYGQDGSSLTAQFGDGTTKDYGVSEPSGTGMGKLWNMIDAIRGKDEIPCPPEAARAHTRFMRLLNDRPIAEFAGKETTETYTWVPGLKEQLVACYEQKKLPSELGYSW